MPLADVIFHCKEKMMKLRNFLYLNTKVVEDYISAIDGYTYDEESQAIATSSENNVSGKVGGALIGGGGEHTGKKEEEIKRSVRISDASKFDRIYRYLESDEDDGLKYFEGLNEETYNELSRDDFLEVLVTARFSKMKEITDSVMKIAELAAAIEPLTDQTILDQEATKANNGFAALSQFKSGKEISCVFEFEDGQYPLIAYLDQSYFRCNQDSFIGQAYLLCKIIRKVPKGQSIKLDEIFDDVKKLPLNRAQRRSMPKNIDNPAELRDIVKGPALVVLPIAVYQ